MSSVLTSMCGWTSLALSLRSTRSQSDSPSLLFSRFGCICCLLIGGHTPAEFRQVRGFPLLISTNQLWSFLFRSRLVHSHLQHLSNLQQVRGHQQVALKSPKAQKSLKPQEDITFCGSFIVKEQQSHQDTRGCSDVISPGGKTGVTEAMAPHQGWHVQPGGGATTASPRPPDTSHRTKQEVMSES